jgi:hypothetical protein
MDPLAYARDGYAVAPALFSPEEVADLRAHVMAVIEAGGGGWTETPVEPDSADPLRRYPRLLQPHRGDERSRAFLLDPRVRAWLEGLTGETPLAVQTMAYFKPPGARGQALHQDQRYLRVEPGTCTAAWLALDDTDPENGCLEVVPGSHRLPVLCPGASDPERSFTNDEVPLPPGWSAVPVPMRAGDVLFFTGNLIHGSGPNLSADRFRRVLIGHDIAADAQQVAHFYSPALTFDGRVVDDLAGVHWGGGPCGVVTGGTGDELVIETREELEAASAAH